MQVPSMEKRVALLIIAATVALLLLGGCGSGAATSQQPASDEAVNLVTRLQKFELGGVEYTATWQNASRSTAAPIKFTIKMDTHSGSLADYDLGKVSILANDSDQQVKASQWDSPGDGHHGTGALYFPPTDSAGKPLINANTKFVEWTISGLAGEPDKKIQWEIRG